MDRSAGSRSSRSLIGAAMLLSVLGFLAVSNAVLADATGPFAAWPL